MTLEQVKKHFKNAEEVRSMLFHTETFKIKGNYHYYDSSIYCTDTKGYDRLLWSPLKGFAQITKYKTMKNTTEVSNEFILKAHQAADREWAAQIEKDFPELFPSRIPEVGKWYTRDSASNLMHYITDIKGHDVIAYGLNFRGEWKDEISFGSVDDFTRFDSDLRPATDEEVEKALIDEAEKRGFKVGVKATTTGGFKGVITDNHNHEFRAKDNNFYFHNLRVFHGGKWATIIQPEKEIEHNGHTYVLKD